MMNRLVFLVGRSVDSRQRLLASKIVSYKGRSFIHLVPTRGKVMDLEVDPPFWLRVRIDTLTRLIYQIFEAHLEYEQFKGYRPIDDASRLLLIKNILQRRGMQPEGLDYFSPLLSGIDGEVDFPGIYRAVSNFFSLLVRNNFQDRFVEDLAKRIIRLEETSPGAGEGLYALESDLTWLFGDFEEIKRELKLYDVDDVVSSVRSYLRSGGIPPILTQNDILVLDGFIQISRVEEDILFHLFSQVREVWWLLDYDSRTNDPVEEFKESVGREPLWHWKEKGGWKHETLGQHEAYRISTSLVSLIERAEEAGFECSIERAIEDPFPNPVAGGLYFHGQLNKAPFESLKIKSFANRADEVRAIAGEIKRIIYEDNLDASIDLGKIRVIFPELENYSSLISEIFGSYKLPFSLTKGLPLSSHPLAHIFRYIIEIPLNHFTREDIFSLFSSPWIKEEAERDVFDKEWLAELGCERLLSQEDLPGAAKFIHKESRRKGDVKLDIFFIDEVARKCGLQRLGLDVSGLWSGALQWVRDYYRDRLEHTTVREERGDLLSECFWFLAQMAVLGETLSPFNELSNQESPEGITECFFQILDRLGFPGNIVRIPEETSGLESEGVRAMLRRDMKAYSLLQALIQASAGEMKLARELFGRKDGYPLLSQFYSTFRLRLHNAFLLDERNPNVVRISQWLEMRGRSFDYVFAGGLTAHQFPLREEVSFILPETPNKMYRMRDLIDESKYLFSHLLRNYRKRLYLSFPRYSDEKEVQPSPVLMDLEAMVKYPPEPDHEKGNLEEVFKWEENPYFTLEGELLDATRMKHMSYEEAKDSVFPWKRIIVRHDSEAERLIKAMDALRCRWAQDGLFEYDGLVKGSVKFHAFLQDKNEIFSPSQLETLANCPMRYLFEHIYSLKTLEELGPEISRREMGQHLHAILRDFFERLRDEKRNVAEMGLNRAFALAEEVADAYFRAHPFLKKLEFYEFQKRDFLAGLGESDAGSVEGSREREGVFAQLLRFEEREFKGTFPAGIEYGFGQEAEAPVALGKSRIRGSIDRFDIVRGHEEAVYVYDYKTGRIPTAEMVKKGLSFQLPAYMLSLKTHRQFRAISAAFYALKREVFLKEYPLKQRVNDHWEGMRGVDMSGVTLIGEYADHLMALLDGGIFHHSTDEVLCPYCEFRYACYRDMRRMNHLLHSERDHHIYSGTKNLEKWKRVDDFRIEWKAISLSMQKALHLKTESARKKHFETVMNYKDWLGENGVSLPFYADYIKELLDKIEHFEAEYLSS